jgi:hypothetical protein
LDRQGQLIALGAALVCFAASALAKTPAGLRELGWLADEGRLEALTREPAFDREALFIAASASPLAAQYPTAEALRADLEVGEALFKTPLLLGGQAAKAGISCHSCHVNGRGNPHFRFPAISGAAGTADTTHSFFSETLGNGVFDPVPIPDLTRPGKVSHDPVSGALEAFILTIVVKEFSGNTPVPGVIAPLATYVRALQLRGSGAADSDQPRRAARDLADAAMMMKQARRQWGSGNGALAELLLAGARDRLAAIHARLIPERHAEARAALIAVSQQLSAVQDRLRANRAKAANFDNALAAWRRANAALVKLDREGQATLYDRAVLAQYLRE